MDDTTPPFLHIFFYSFMFFLRSATVAQLSCVVTAVVLRCLAAGVLFFVRRRCSAILDVCALLDWRSIKLT
jgi:hypothetical protein